MIALEVMNARQGDALLLRYNVDGTDRLWIIDGGPPGVLRASLQPRLDELRGDDESQRIDLAMVSHFDADHMAGMVELTNDLVHLKKAGKTLPLDIQRFWHNGFREIVGSGDLSGIAPVASAASLAAGNDDLGAVARQFSIDTVAGQLVLASVNQGAELTANINTLRIPLNDPIGQRIEAPATLELDGAKVTFLGPLKSRLDALKREWADAVVNGDTTRLVRLFREDLDEGIPNLSSISMLVEIGDRTLLLTGDARGDDIVAGWKAAGRDETVPFPVDILKMPHHGSDRNVSEDFLRLFPAEHYVISADGKYGNPDVGAIRAITVTQGDREYTLHLTNDTPAMQPTLEALEEERRKPGRKFNVRFRDPGSEFLDIHLDSDSSVDERKDFFDLDPALLSGLVFDTFGDQRYTQDSPIMPDVWAAFARTPRAKIDLLLTPLAGDSASQLAAMLSDRLSLFATGTSHEAGLRNLPAGELLQRLAAQPKGADKRSEFDIAYSRSSVVAEIDFDQLICVVVSMTHWWSSLHQSVKNFDEFKRKLNYGSRGERTLAQIISESDVIANRSAWDFIRFSALVGFIALKRRFEEDAERDRVEPGTEEHEKLRKKLEELLRFLTRGTTRIRQVGEIIDAYGDVAKCVGEYGQSLFSDRPDRPHIFMITENRNATLSVAASRGTIKADAAHNLFKIDTSDFRWAVIDGGIDAQHPAFLDRRAVERYQADLAASALPLPASAANGLSQEAQEKWGQGDIALDQLAKFSRVRHTYDFTYLRRMLSLKDLPKPADGGPSEKRAAYIRANYRTQLESLKVRTVRALEIDWDAIAPLIRVPHDEFYTKPQVGHGTHVAGILGGHWEAKDNPEKVDLIGICPEIGLYDLRVYKPGGADEFTVQYALQFVEHLNRNRDIPLIHGVNLSVSMAHKVMSFACGRTPVCDECNALVGTGVVVVVAAGNDGYKTYKTDKGEYSGYHTASITDPGNAEDVITVGSTHRSHPHNYGVSYFSSRGPTGDGRRKPDLVAPGEKITAPVLNRGVQRMDGTSMAAPHVSGAAALLMARHRELIRSPRRIKEILCRTATDLGREAHFQGAGMVDILRALQSV